MKTKLTRSAISIAAAAAFAGGALMTAGHANASLGQLKVTAYDKCVTNQDEPATDRTIWIENVGNTTVTNIQVNELGGPTHGIPRLAKNQETKPANNLAVRYYSFTGVKVANQLAPGERVKTWRVVKGCQGPWVTAGYVTGNPADAIGADLHWDINPPSRHDIY